MSAAATKKKAYRATAAIDRRRDSADGILRAVDAGGFIELGTLVELLRLLGTRTNYRFHVAVEVQTNAILKTIDNERDAKETIRRLKEKRA